MSKLLQLERINFTYSKNSTNSHHTGSFFLKDISLIVDEGNFISVIGKNGSGKSTLVKLISKVLLNYNGNILYKGSDIHSFERKRYAQLISYLPQTNESFHVDLTINEFLLLGRYAYKQSTDFTFSKEDKEIVAKSIKETGIDYLQNKYLFELSGGERQKVLLTLGLVQLDITKSLEGKILIIDEPLTYLDVNYQYDIFNNLKKLNERKLTIIIVIHDLNLALNYTHKSILMNNGEMVLYSDSKKVISEEILKEHFLIDSKIVNYGNNSLINYLA